VPVGVAAIGDTVVVAGPLCADLWVLTVGGTCGVAAAGGVVATDRESTTRLRCFQRRGVAFVPVPGSSPNAAWECVAGRAAIFFVAGLAICGDAGAFLTV